MADLIPGRRSDNTARLEIRIGDLFSYSLNALEPDDLTSRANTLRKLDELIGMLPDQATGFLKALRDTLDTRHKPRLSIIQGGKRDPAIWERTG
ncbi:hypothetical protein [Methylobacterium nodulans]|uniref:Uncharacterized protein n=1 Tax=Methylobacterium nodulans (strain LMG 21967 / CNCM I-2342 / ORS 2060) TaxID=460265 RepID=B8IQA9_METNO|nr:hypothetical protein [Methylobacterium nodulans]ACL58609.1 hypothetical protein Mnod_3702 [Methylobacterium nodulans ORS 2060]